MTHDGHHLAQFNIAWMRGPLDSPVMADFVAQLEAVNAVADAAPGFVWRLQEDAGNATAIRPYDDERVLVNMSVWAGVEPLREYVFRSVHAAVLRERRRWFERVQRQTYVLWWVPAGHIPSVDEAKERLERLERDGEGPHAFTFAHPQPPPG